LVALGTISVEDLQERRLGSGGSLGACRETMSASRPQMETYEMIFMVYLAALVRLENAQCFPGRTRGLAPIERLVFQR
jgi:hypothetical protein